MAESTRTASGNSERARFAVACALVLAGCARPAEVRRRATEALRDGDTVESARLAREARKTCRSDAVCAALARAIEAEALLRDGSAKMRAEAADLIAEPIRGIDGSPEAQARLLTLEAALNPRRKPQVETRAMLGRAQEIARSGGARDALLDAQNWEGQALAQSGRPQEAEKVLLGEREAALSAGDRYHDALASNTLGMIRLKQERYEDAMAWFERTLDAAQHGGGKRQAATALLNRGICYARLGVFDRALQSLEAALAATGGHGPTLLRMNTLGELGSAYLLAGDPRKAAGYYRQAAALAESRPDLARWHGDLATALADLGEWDEAERNNEQARKHAMSLEARALAVQRAGAIAAGRGQLREAIARYQEAVELASDDAPVAAWEAHAGLVEAYTGVGAHGRAQQEFERTGDYIDRNLAQIASDEHKAAFFARLISFHQQYVRALVERKAYDAALKVADSSRARILCQRLALRATAGPASVAYSRIAAARNSVLLFYWVAPERSYLWVVTRDRVHLPIDLPGAAQLEKWVDDYDAFLGRSLGDPLARPNEAGRRLYDALLAPAARLIPRGANLIVAPDGPLHWLNLETLPVYGETPHYVADDFRVEIAPSLGTLAAADPRRAPATPAMLVIGDPISAGPEYPALTYAAREIDNIRRAIPAARVERGAAATPEAYRQAPGFSLLHFSAHAVANAQNPLESAIVLSRGAGDYRLYARDVLGAPLSADLVTLSACRSAGARSYSGEGLVGFAWAFLQAGARHVIAGLWDVTDSSTPEIMDVLYSRLAKGEPPADALRAAKLRLIRSSGGYRRPYYWGPFQIYTR